MERHQIIEAMTNLKLYGMRASFDEIAGKGLGRREELYPLLASLVRAMNCYYSNLIEGHDTHPIDIERALRDDYSQDRKKRDLQIEAKAHMAVESAQLMPSGTFVVSLVDDAQPATKGDIRRLMERLDAMDTGQRGGS